MQRNLKMAIALCAAPWVAGCAGLELAHLVGQTLTQEVSTIARANHDVPVQPGVKVYAFEMFEQRPLWVTPCQYSGVIVEYAQDWDQVAEDGHVVRKANPDKMAGYALLLNKEQCPDEEPADILKVGSQEFNSLFGPPKYAIRKGHGRTAVNYYGLHGDMRPKWMPGVVETIKAEASSNPAAAAFLAQMQERSYSNLFN